MKQMIGIAEISLVILAIPVTIFPFLYCWLADWSRYREGRASMVSSTALMLLVDISVINSVWLHIVDPFVALVINELVFIAIFIGSTYKIVSLLRAQLGSRRRERNNEPAYEEDAHLR